MYIIVGNIFRFFLQLMTPQNEDECELGWENHAEESRVCIATGYPSLSVIVKLQHVHSTFGDIKNIALYRLLHYI
jgi:hypothetical protein